MNLKGQWVSILCYKHDGSIHREWDRGFVLLDDVDYIVVATKKAKVVENNGKKWMTHEPAVTIFSKKQWWNVICMFKKDGICYYCNIASPSIVENKTIKYIDYDLDVKLFPDKSIVVLDEKEYEKHKKHYNYSDDLDHVLKYQTTKIEQRMKNDLYPFKDSLIQEYYDHFLSLITKENKNDKQNSHS